MREKKGDRSNLCDAPERAVPANSTCPLFPRPTRKEASMQADQRQELRVHIRWMIRRDMPEVLAAEIESFEFPWSEEDFIRCLRQRNCIGMVAEHEDRVVGFMIYELHKSRIHVLNFAVAAGCRRMGVGSQMIAKLTAKLSAAAAEPDHSRSPRDEPGRPAVLPRERFSRRLGAAELLRRHARRRLPDAIPLPARAPAGRRAGRKYPQDGGVGNAGRTRFRYGPVRLRLGLGDPPARIPSCADASPCACRLALWPNSSPCSRLRPGVRL